MRIVLLVVSTGKQTIATLWWYTIKRAAVPRSRFVPFVLKVCGLSQGIGCLKLVLINSGLSSKLMAIWMQFQSLFLLSGWHRNSGNKVSGPELKALRISLGLSLSKAARQVEVSARTFARWESGKQRIPDGAVKLLIILNSE